MCDAIYSSLCKCDSNTNHSCDVGLLDCLMWDIAKILSSSLAWWLRSLTLVQRVPGSIPGRAQNLFPPLLALFLHLTCGPGAVDDKDLTVSSNQGKAWVFVHLTLWLTVCIPNPAWAWLFVDSTLGIIEQHLTQRYATLSLIKHDGEIIL